MARRVLITGVTGFLGKRIAAARSEAGDRIVGLSRDAVGARQQVPVLLDAYDWRGVRDAPAGEAFEGTNAVVHLAGEPVAGRWTPTKRRIIEESRVLGTRRIVDAIEATTGRPAVLVCASAIGFYGDRGDEELDEDAGSGDDFLAGVCVGWEREAKRAEALGVRVVRVRIGLVMGKEGGALEAMLPLFRAGLGGRIGSGEQFWPWVHIDDVVRLFCAAIDDVGYDGAFNGVAPTPVRQAEFAKTLAKVLRRPAFLPAPALAIKTMLGGVAAELLASRRVVPKRTVEAGFEHRFTELEPALRDLLG
jgi:hypothetical protein